MSIARPLDLGKPVSLGRPISIGRPVQLYKSISWNPPKKPKKQVTYPEAQARFGLLPCGDIDKDGRPNYLDCRPYNSEMQGIFGDITAGIKKRFTGAEPEEELPPEEFKKKKRPTRKQVKELQKEGIAGPYEEIPGDKVAELRRVAKEKVVGAKEYVEKGVKKRIKKVKEFEPVERFGQMRRYKKAVATGIEETAALPWFIVVKIRNDKWYQWGPYETKVIANNTLKRKIGELGRTTIEKSHLSQDPNEARGRNMEERLEHVSGRVAAYQAETGLTKKEIAERVKKGIEPKVGLEEAFREVIPTRPPGVGPPAAKEWYRPGAAPLQRRKKEDIFERRFRRALLGKPLDEEPTSREGMQFGLPKRERLPQEERPLQPKYPITFQPRQPVQPVEYGYEPEAPITPPTPEVPREVTRTIYTPQGPMEKTFRTYKPFKPKIAKLGYSKGELT